MPAWLAWPAIKSVFGGWLKAAWAAIASFFRALNAQGWIGLVVGVLLAVLWIRAAGEARHWRKQSNQFEKLYRADEASLRQIAASAKQIADRAAELAKAIRSRTDETNRHIHSDAGNLRLLGPGKAAVCHPIPASAGGQVAASGTADAAGPRLPATDSAAVPWSWLVDRAEQADLNRAEVIAWREWYDAMVKVQGAKR